MANKNNSPNNKKISRSLFTTCILFSFLVSSLLFIYGCNGETAPPQTPGDSKDQEGDPLAAAAPNTTGASAVPIESCAVDPASFECSSYSLTRSKIMLFFYNRFDKRMSVMDFRLKSDGAAIICDSSTNTNKIAVDVYPGGAFSLSCGGIPTGRLTYKELDDITFEMDYKFQTDNTLRTAYGEVKAVVK
jgi:hypothetical protein